MKKRSRISKIWTIKKRYLQKLLDESGSIVEVLEKLGYDGYNGNHRTINIRIKEDKLDLEKFNINKKALNKKRKRNKIPDSEVFKENSTYSSNKGLKRKLLEDQGFAYECSECDNKGEHNGKPLSLQLDHINGISNDNRLENLRFLCPNCHSQTKTFSGKKTKINHYCSCGNKKVTKQALKCQKCANKEKNFARRKFDISEQDLYNLVCIQKLPFTKLGLMFEVSDNAIRKRCVKYGIDPKARKFIK